MNSKDFSFLGKKEFILLLLFLLALVFSQIALEDQRNLNDQKPFNKPFIILESSFFEDLGIFIPILTILFLFIHNRRKQEYSRLPPSKHILLFVLFFATVTILLIPENVENLLPEVNTTSTTTIPETLIVTSRSIVPPHGTEIITDRLIDSSFIFRVLFIIGFLLLPLFLLFLIQGRGKVREQINETEEMLTIEEQQKQFRMNTIIECYLQASNTLEERGADKSPSITPTEFIKDVTEKKLTEKKTIGGITELYEEARFSNHEITLDKVAKAKELSRGIISSWWEQEKNRIEEGKQ
ncbi:MAG: DUF4129 domain-containing protein [Candidatus Hodarchaeales archaeon]